MGNGVWRRKRTDTCYLCGEELAKPRSKDHVPPKCFWPSIVIQEVKPDNLWTLQTHVECNNSYKDDEEYFVNALRLFVPDTWAGGALQVDFLNRITKHEGSMRLFGRTFRETRWQRFATPSARGSVLVGIDYEKSRIDRVSWKILRGLQFVERGVILPAEMTLRFACLGSARQAPDGLSAWWKGASGAGRYPYPRVFEYRFKRADESDTGEEQWMLRFWEGLIWWTAFPGPIATPNHEQGAYL
jgi:hypothetical protein